MYPTCVLGFFHHRQELLRGPLLYIAIVVSVTLLFWRESPIGLLALCLMCGGDGLADIVGRRYGSAKLPFNHSKSWVGSLAMFTGTANSAACRKSCSSTAYLPKPQRACYCASAIIACHCRPDEGALMCHVPCSVGYDCLYSIGVNGGKSFVAGGGVLSMTYIALFHKLGYFAANARSMMPVIWATSFVATVIEALPIHQRLDDNLTVPLVSAAVGQLLMRCLHIA